MDLKTVTGSNGELPVFDGTMRGAIVAVLNICIGLLSTVVDIDAEQLAYLFAALNPLTFILFGIFDVIIKKPAPATEPATRPE